MIKITTQFKHISKKKQNLYQLFEQDQDCRYLFKKDLYNKILRALKLYNVTLENLMELFNVSFYQLTTFVVFNEYESDSNIHVLNVALQISPSMSHVGNIENGKKHITNIIKNINDTSSHYFNTNNHDYNGDNAVVILMTDDKIIFSVDLDLINKNSFERIKYCNHDIYEKGRVFNEFNPNERGRFDSDIDFINNVYSRYPFLRDEYEQQKQVNEQQNDDFELIAEKLISNTLNRMKTYKQQQNKPLKDWVNQRYGKFINPDNHTTIRLWETSIKNDEQCQSSDNEYNEFLECLNTYFKNKE